MNPKLVDVLALKGEALSALGRYEEAIKIFDGVLAAHPKDVDTLNARASPGRRSDGWPTPTTTGAVSSTCCRRPARRRASLRGDAHANYSAAFNEFGLAVAKEPNNPYWLLYRLTAARLAGAPAEAVTPAAMAGRHCFWPSGPAR